MQDSERVRASAPQLSKLLKALASTNKIRAIDLIVQATGITAVIAALKEAGDDVKLNTLIAVAPDVDAAELEAQCGLLQKKAKNLTVYASSNDRALDVSETLNGSKRAGQITAQGPLISSACADVIDTSALGGSMLEVGHSLAVTSAAGLQDIRALLQTGIRPPSQRSAVLKPAASQLRPGEIFWRF